MEDRMTAQKLKNSILQMAVQGKLVPQDQNDEPASVLLERIRKEKEQLIKEGKIKRNKNESFIFRGADNLHYEQIGKEVRCIEDELPFEIPDSWECVRLDKLGIYKKGPFGSALTKSMFVPKSDNSIKVYEQKNAIQKNWKLGDYYISKKYYFEKMQSFTVNPGDIIVSCAGTIGETYIMPFNIDAGIINQALMKMTISRNINVDYFLLVFNNIIKSVSTKNSKGSAIKNIPPFSILKQIIVPIPPREEQERIINKINELVPLIESYKHSEELLYELNSNIKEQLKKSILQYAIEGKLVPQDSNDEPASFLLERIRKEKEKMIAEGVIKKDKNESIIYRRDNSYYEKQSKNDVCIDEQIPFSIPDSWCWIRFKEFTSFNIGKTPERDNDRFWFDGEYPWVSIADLVENGLVNSTNEKISKLALDVKFSNKLVKQGTLLMSFKLTVGKTSILDIDAVHNEAIISITPYLDYNNITRNYLFYSMPLLSLNGETKKAIKGNTLNSKSLNALLIPVPPIQEQRRIVDMIVKLNSLIG